MKAHEIAAARRGFDALELEQPFLERQPLAEGLCERRSPLPLQLAEAGRIGLLLALFVVFHEGSTKRRLRWRHVRFARRDRPRQGRKQRDKKNDWFPHTHSRFPEGAAWSYLLLDLPSTVLTAPEVGGIATHLIVHLIRIARAAALKEFVAEVLAENVPMLKVFERRGLAMTTRRERGIVHATLAL